MRHDAHPRAEVVAHCCPTCQCSPAVPRAAGAGLPPAVPAVALRATALAGLSWSALATAGGELPEAPPRRPLAVQPIFTYPLPTRRNQTSWRNWGGVQTHQDVQAETARIRGELDKLQAKADFPLKMFPLAAIRTPNELGGIDWECLA